MFTLFECFSCNVGCTMFDTPGLPNMLFIFYFLFGVLCYFTVAMTNFPTGIIKVSFALIYSPV